MIRSDEFPDVPVNYVVFHSANTNGFGQALDPKGDFVPILALRSPDLPKEPSDIDVQARAVARSLAVYSVSGSLARLGLGAEEIYQQLDVESEREHGPGGGSKRGPTQGWDISWLAGKTVGSQATRLANAAAYDLQELGKTIRDGEHPHVMPHVHRFLPVVAIAQAGYTSRP